MTVTFNKSTIDREIELLEKSYSVVGELLTHTKVFPSNRITDYESYLKLLYKVKEFGFEEITLTTYGDTWNKVQWFDDVYFGIHKHGSIDWSDDGRQPDNEWLLKVYFPTGAYFFSRDYLTDLFDKFFDELKAFKPKYSDTTNNCLYFDETTAKDVIQNLKPLIIKYKEQVAHYRKEQQIKEFESKLKELKGENV